MTKDNKISNIHEYMRAKMDKRNYVDLTEN
jgi:hypothetical protein